MRYLLFLLFTVFILSGCNKDDNPFAGNDQLPAATQTGANTAGCLLNGNVFIPHQEGINPVLVCNYELLDGKYYFNLVIADDRGIGVKNISVRTSEIDLGINNIYILNQDNTIFEPYVGAGGFYGINASNYYFTNNIKTGELKITRLDLQNSIISGTFWFDAINSSGETVEIREGRFDMQY